MVEDFFPIGMLRDRRPGELLATTSNHSGN